MTSPPRVSVVTIFLDAERFLGEAIASVFAQSFEAWELLLVDDGSRDASGDVARAWAARDPARVRYLAHPGGENRGMSASRNLARRHARGELLAFLDADDVWRPEKLERHVEIADAWPQAGMIYGATEYWYSWTGSPVDRARDYVGGLGTPAERLVWPPALLACWLRDGSTVPCMGSLVVRRALVSALGGFEEAFRDQYEDQVFYAKVALAAPIFVTAQGWDRYRQHPDSDCARAGASGRARIARARFLRWLDGYLTEHGVQDDELRRLVRRERRRTRIGSGPAMLRRLVARWAPSGAGLGP
jgi:glycosyltransferase involved in cell wall biosynthesis